MKALGRDSVLSGRDCGLTVNQSGRCLAPDGVSPYHPHNPSISTKRTKLPKAGQPS